MFIHFPNGIYIHCNTHVCVCHRTQRISTVNHSCNTQKYFPFILYRILSACVLCYNVASQNVHRDTHTYIQMERQSENKSVHTTNIKLYAPSQFIFFFLCFVSICFCFCFWLFICIWAHIHMTLFISRYQSKNICSSSRRSLKLTF